MSPIAEIGVFGGSGFYEFLDSTAEVETRTPYGSTSGPVKVGKLGERNVAFLARHGNGHRVPPHRINARANVWAFHELGVERILAPCAVGSLRPDVHPGDIVVLDQLVERTWGRRDTYFDGHDLWHLPFADPYCPELSQLVVASGERLGITTHPAGTVVVIQGPRFSTRAESQWFRAQGWDVVNMTQYPEAALARELGMCYSGIAQVTDYDTGTQRSHQTPAVTMDSAFAMLEKVVDKTRQLLEGVISELPHDRSCGCIRGAPNADTRSSPVPTSV